MSSWRRHGVGLALAWSLVVPTKARAADAFERDVAVGSGPLFVGATSPRVERQQIVLTCRDEGNVPVCDFTARYAIANRTPHALPVTGAFYARHVRQLRLSTDDSSAGASLPAEAIAGLEARVHRVLCFNFLSVFFTAYPADECFPRRGSIQPMANWTERAFALPLAPQQTRWLAAAGTLEPGAALSSPWPEPPASTRHRLLGRQVERTYYINYWLNSGLDRDNGDAVPDSSVMSAIETEVEVRLPAAWVASVRSPRQVFSPRRALSAAEWQTRDEDGWQVAHRWFSAENLPVALSIEIRRVPSFLRLGGAFSGAGSTLNGAVESRMRFGYELALGRTPPASMALASVSVDTNWRGLALVTPGFELATPMLELVPSLGLGVGLPVVLAPRRQLGLRGLLGVHFFGLGVVVSYDWFPRTMVTALAGGAQWTLLGQLSL
jgi:hypothetical protein